MRKFLFLACMLLSTNNIKTESIKLYPHLFPVPDAAPLFLAIKKGDLKEVQMQIALGVDVNARGSNYHATPLIMAAVTGRLDIIDQLLESGADIDAQDDNLDTALHRAAANNMHAVVGLLLSKRPKTSLINKKYMRPLDAAAAMGHDKVIDAFSKSGVSINSKGARGLSALHWAALWGQREAIDSLLRNGADINAQDNYGNTPVDAALDRSKYGTAEILIEKGGKRGSELRQKDDL